MGRYRLQLSLVGDGFEEYPCIEVDLAFCPVIGHVFATDCGFNGIVDEVMTWLDSPPYVTDIHLRLDREIRMDRLKEVSLKLKNHGWQGFEDDVKGSELPTEYESH